MARSATTVRFMIVNLDMARRLLSVAPRDPILWAPWKDHILKVILPMLDECRADPMYAEFADDLSFAVDRLIRSDLYDGQVVKLLDGVVSKMWQKSACVRSE